jgi:hypothetical protein
VLAGVRWSHLGEEKWGRSAWKLLDASMTFCQSNLIAKNFNGSAKLFFFFHIKNTRPKRPCLWPPCEALVCFYVDLPLKIRERGFADNAVEHNFYRLISPRYFGV